MRYVISLGAKGYVHLSRGPDSYDSDFTLRPKLKDATAFRTRQRAERRAQGLGLLPGRFNVEVIRR